MSTQHMQLHVPVWTLGDRLRKAREDAGLSQAELAAAVAVSRTTVSNAEVGARVPLRVTLHAWSDVTGVPVEWLITGDGEPVPPNGHPVKLINFSDTELMQYRYKVGPLVKVAS